MFCSEASKEELLYLLEQREYEILIENIDDSRFVTFNHTVALHPYKLKHCYSTEYSDIEIKKDVVFDLLRWSGLKVKHTLDY